jgi:hypothetical protein
MKQQSLSPINLLGAAVRPAAVSGVAFNLDKSINIGFRNMKGFAQSGSGEGTALVSFQENATSTASATTWTTIANLTLSSAIGLSQVHFIPTKQWLRAAVVPSGSIAVSAAALAEYGLV